MSFPPTWDICGLGLPKRRLLFALILYMYLVAFSIHFLLWSHPSVVEPHPLLTAPSAQNSTGFFHHTEMGVHLLGSCVTNTPRNSIKQVRQQFLFFHSMVFVFWEFSKLPLLNNVFSKKSRCGFFAFRDGRGNSLQARAGWLGRKTSTDTNYPTEDKREARFSFTFLWGNCVAQPRLRAALN